jgi:hypothetical protein
MTREQLKVRAMRRVLTWLRTDQNSYSVNDPEFVKFRQETVPPDQRNWRNLQRDLNNYRRYLNAKKWTW